MEDKYKNKYDDPYRMLAASIAVRMSIQDAKRMLKDNDFIKQLVLSEVRENADIPGMFTDCITTELLANSHKVLYKSALNELGEFFYKQLDTARLKGELKKFYEEFNIDIMS